VTASVGLAVTTHTVVNPSPLARRHPCAAPPARRALGKPYLSEDYSAERLRSQEPVPAACRLYEPAVSRQATQPSVPSVATMCQPGGASGQLACAGCPDGQATSTTVAPAGGGWLAG
jgi:hypothetical protein